MQIREAVESDAAALLRLFNQLDSESNFMLFEPGERQTTEPEQQAIIAAFAQSERRFMCVAETAGNIIGFCVLVGNQQRRNAHTASLVIGVAKSHWRQGTGAKLLETVIGKADTAGIERIELTVRTDNRAALALYQKFGFVIEGERIGSLNIGGNRVNEFYMARV